MYNDNSAALLAALLGLILVMAFFGVVFYVISSIFLMKIFEKAGVHGKWRAWVPVYNTMVFAKLGDLNPWWQLVLWVLAGALSQVPVINVVLGLAAALYSVLAAWRVGLKLQKEAVWLILYVLLSIVWMGIAAFDKSRWNLAVPAAPWQNSFLADNTVWSGIPVQAPVGGYPANPVMQAPGYPAPGQPQAPGYPQQGAPGAYPPAPPAAPGAYPPPAAAPGAYPPAAPQPPAGPAVPPAPPAGPDVPPAPPAGPEVPPAPPQS